ncbi:Protein ALWAYS EARLY 2 [Bienertia sinuspersici]
MVEALYNMNRAYLSLPEGTASVVGLIAMMTDHYNVLEGTGSEKDSEGPEVMVRKSQKNPKAKTLPVSSRDESRRQSVGANHGCLSLLQNHSDGIQPRFPVKKRTPRVPVSCLDIHPNKKSRVSVMNTDSDSNSYRDFISKEAWPKPNSPYVSQAKHKIYGDLRTSHASGREDVVSQFPVRKTKVGGFVVGEEYKERSLGFNEARNGNLGWDSVDLGKSALAEYKKGKKEEVHHSEAKLFDHIREAYKYAERGSRSSGYDGKCAKICQSTSEGQRKKRKKLTSEDELAACDALQTLAEMSSMMPYLDAEPVEDAGESMTGQDAMGNTIDHFDGELSNEKAGGELKKKHVSQPSKMQKMESPTGYSKKAGENESVADEDVKPVDSSGQVSAVSTRCKSSLKSPEVSSSNDLLVGETEVAISSAQVNPASMVVNPTRRKSRRKKERTLLSRNYAATGYSSDSLVMLHDRMQGAKGNLLHCLSSHEVRQWCVYEWFYSAIDYPWFAKRDIVDYLNHVGLGHIPKLTRVELGFVRGSLGKPRRFSERFLQEERGKLEQYRESVRTHYVRAGLGEGLPTDLASPLKVGQQVIAIHPKTRECHNGSVLTVDRDNYLIQFYRPDLGVELVMDIDCMPLNPLENMPEALRRQKMLLDHQWLQVPKVNGTIISASEDKIKNVGQYLHVRSFCTSVPNDSKARPACLSSHVKVVGNGSIKAAQATQIQSHKTAQMQLLDGQTRPIPGLIGDLDRKLFDQNSACPENPYWPLPATGSGVNGTMHSSNNFSFSCQESASNVAEIIEGSKDKAQKMVDTAIKRDGCRRERENEGGCRREIEGGNGGRRETGGGGRGGRWRRTSSGLIILPNSFNIKVEEVEDGGKGEQEEGAQGIENAMSIMKEGEDAFGRISDALDTNGKAECATNCRKSMLMSSNKVRGSFPCQNPSTSCTSESQLACNGFGVQSVIGFASNDIQLPSKLITSCVATLLMIQTCTERQYPPAEVAQILDNAATSLHPGCPQNVSIYREIQMCMGRIKTQILALVPT